MFELVARNIACQTIVALSFFCSTLEVILALERILSSIEPHIYHLRGSSPFSLIILTVNVSLLSAYVGYSSHGLCYIKLGGVILSVVDFSTILINLFAVRFCKGRYEKMFDKATLNARYQVKEAYEMALAMRPVYFYSLVVRVRMRNDRGKSSSIVHRRHACSWELSMLFSSTLICPLTRTDTSKESIYRQSR
ncbi:hypothetical protein PENTCL1PPCAC_2550 [Pristionchus entomophagus]|uniref:G protein-coupled receptor n=1 Tax=Pristionchus entomophagus TaxID=358040 RepID=A0AAV5SBY3_9BILA|nr:hypothetical protein PENTCL1PPCAC_2550 [Pristionchus entomophagus]